MCTNPGLEIALSDSLGAALTASFRANAVAFHNLFCDMANQSAVVRACSEWFAVSLALLSPLQDEDHEDEGEGQMMSITPRRQRQHHQEPSHHLPSPPSPATTIATMTPASSISTPAATAGVGDEEHGLEQRAEVRAWSASSKESHSASGLTREVGLALTAVILARRLSRSPGPCFPVELRSVLGLDHHEEALKFVAQGIAAARRTLQVETGQGAGAGIVSSSRTAGGPGSVFAGELVFEKTIGHEHKAHDIAAISSLDRGVDRGVHSDSMPTSGAFKVRLLELLTPEYDDERYLPRSPQDHNSERTAAERKDSSSDVSCFSASSGFPTACTGAAIGVDEAFEDAVSRRTNEEIRTSMCKAGTPGNGISNEGSSLTYSSSSSDSRFNTSRVAENGKTASGGTRGISEVDIFAEEFMPKDDASCTHGCSPSPWSPLHTEEPRSGSQRDCAFVEHSLVLTDRENSYCSSSSNSSSSNSSCRSNSHSDNTSVGSNRNSISCFDYEAAVRAAAEDLYGYRTSRDDGGISSSLFLPYPSLTSRTAAGIAHPTSDTSSVDESVVEVDNEKNRGGDDDGNNNSRKRRGRTEEVPSKSSVKKVRINEWSVRCRPPHQGTVRSAEEERLVRWDMLTNRIHMALEYDCGCSFCQLGMAVVVRSTREREGHSGKLHATATGLSVPCDNTVTPPIRSPDFFDCGQNSDVEASGVVTATSHDTMLGEFKEGDTPEATDGAEDTVETTITEIQAETMKDERCNQRYIHPGRSPSTYVGGAVGDTIAGGVQLPAEMEVPDFSMGVPIAAGTRQQEEETTCSSEAKQSGIPSTETAQNSGERDDAGRTETYYPAADTCDSSASLSSWMIPAFVARTAGKTIVLNDATGGALFGDTCAGGGEDVGTGASDHRNGVTRKDECIP